MPAGVAAVGLMPVLEYLPLARVMAVTAAPPIGVRSAVTVEMLLLMSVTVQERVDVEAVPAGRVEGVNVHDVNAGGWLGAVTVREAVLVPVPPEASVAVVVIV